MTKRDEKIFALLFGGYFLTGLCFNQISSSLQVPRFRSLLTFSSLISSSVWITYFIHLHRYPNAGSNLLGLSIRSRALLPLSLSVLAIGIYALEAANPVTKPGWHESIFALNAAVEEVVFRGLLIKMIVSRGANKRMRLIGAVVFSSIIFSAAHISIHGMHQSANMFLLSTLLGILSLWSDSIAFGLVIHVMSNVGAIMACLFLLLYPLVAFISTKFAARAFPTS